MDDHLESDCKCEAERHYLEDEEIDVCDEPEDLSVRRDGHTVQKLHVRSCTPTSDFECSSGTVPRRRDTSIERATPLRCLSKASNDNNRRSSPYFSIDNILRPDFGAKENNDRGSRQHRPQGYALEQEKPRTKDALWPAWVYCTRYSDRPSSGPRVRKIKRREKRPEEKRPRTAFTTEQLTKLKTEFEESRYLSEARRQQLARDLGLNESQIKIWFQNKRAKMKKSAGQRNSLALHLMAQGLYNHATINIIDDENDESNE